jgi:hypothetical protein
MSRWFALVWFLQRTRWVVPAAALPVSGCYTTASTVNIRPLETRYPVSASLAYVDADGAIVHAPDYRVVRPFSFTRELDAPVLEETEAALRLEPELDRLVVGARGDAVTRLRIVAFDYDAGSHRTAATLRTVGWIAGLHGALLLAIGAANLRSDGDEDARDAGLILGGVCAGIATASFAFGALSDSPAQWKFQISGLVVQRKAAPSGVLPFRN